MLPPIQVHKILLEHIRRNQSKVSIKQLAEDLQVEINELLPTIEVLRHLQVVEMEDEEESVLLTYSGMLANLDLQ